MNECVFGESVPATALNVNTYVAALSVVSKEQFSTSHLISDVKDEIGSCPTDADLVTSTPNLFPSCFASSNITMAITVHQVTEELPQGLSFLMDNTEVIYSFGNYMQPYHDKVRDKGGIDMMECSQMVAQTLIAPSYRCNDISMDYSHTRLSGRPPPTTDSTYGINAYASGTELTLPQFDIQVRL